MNLERAGLCNFLVEQCILVGSAASEQGHECGGEQGRYAHDRIDTRIGRV